MTTHPKSTDLLPVTQADREAAANLRMLLPPLAGSREIAAMRDGDLDDSAYVQAFARHRISHASVAREDVARIINPNARWTGWGSKTPEAVSDQDAAFAKADAILALLPASSAQAVTPTPASNFSADAEQDDAGPRADASSILASIDPDDIGKLVDESAWDEDTIMSDDDRNDRQNEAAETAEAILTLIKDKLK